MVPPIVESVEEIAESANVGTEEIAAGTEVIEVVSENPIEPTVPQELSDSNEEPLKSEGNKPNTKSLGSILSKFKILKKDKPMIKPQVNEIMEVPEPIESDKPEETTQKVKEVEDPLPPTRKPKKFFKWI